MIYFNGIPIENAIKILLNGTILWEGGSDIPDISEYIQDGLVFHLDGINKGDDDTAWTDLIGGKKFVYNNCILNDNNIEFNGIDSYAQHSSYLVFDEYQTFTTEGCFDVTEGNIFHNGQYVSSYKTHPCLIVRTNNNINILNINRFRTVPMPRFGVPHSISYTRLSNSGYSSSTGTTHIGDYGMCDFKLLNVQSSYNFSTGSFSYGKALVGALNTSSTAISNYLKGKVYSIRLYDRHLTKEEMAHNQMIDYLRFKLPVDKINLNLTNDRGEAITNALVKINDAVFTYTEPTTYLIPKGSEYSIWFNGVEYHRAPEAIIDQCGSLTINAVYTYTGFQDGLMLEVETSRQNELVHFYTTLVTINEVDWGDGTIDKKISHYYTTQGTYIIKVRATFSADWSIEYTSTLSLKRILQWPVDNYLKSFIYEGASHTPSKFEYFAPTIVKRKTHTTATLEISYAPITNIASYTGYYSTSSAYGKNAAYVKIANNEATNYHSYYVYSVTNVDSSFSCVSAFQGGTLTPRIKAKKIGKYYEEGSTGLTPTATNLNIFNTIKDLTEIVYLELSKYILDLYHGKGVVRDFSGLVNWGTESEENRQSLVRSLVNNTVDLFESGLVNEKIKLSSKSLSLLTEEEIAQITSKGYTLT